MRKPATRRRQLEDAQDRPGSGRLRGRARPARPGRHRRRRSSRSPLAFPALPALVGRAGTASHPPAASRRSASQNVHAEPQGAFTGEVSLPMLQASGVTLRHHRSLRAAPPVRRDRRRRQCARPGRPPAPDLTPIVCVGETLAEREAERDVRRARPPDRRGARGPVAGPGGRRRRRLRAGLGHRDRPRRHAPTRPRRRTRRIRRPAGRPGSATPPPARAASCTAAASSPATRPR